MHVVDDGGSGANGRGSYGGGAGGPGAEVTGDLAVTPTETLYVWAGGAGQPGGGAGFGNPGHSHFGGGTGGGADGSDFGAGNGGGGGAASYITDGSNVLVAAGGGGGGGGSGTYIALTDTSGAAGSSGGYFSTSYGTSFGDAGPGSSPNGGAAGGVEDVTHADNGGTGATNQSLDLGGGGGGGGGGYFACANYAVCFAAGGGGAAGSAAYGAGGGAGGDSYAGSSLSNYAYGKSPFGAGHAGQVTISYGAPSTTTLYTSTATLNPGQSVTLRAFVDPTDGGGTVSFTSDGTAISGCSNLPFLSGGGTDWETSCTTSSLPSGAHYVNAIYSGDSNYAGSSVPYPPIVTVLNGTTTSVTAAHPTTQINAADSVTATIHSSDGGGTVSFTQGGVPVSNCSGLSLVAAGGAYKAVCQLTWAQSGSYAITANYSGDSDGIGYAPSSATTTVQVVNSAPAVSGVTPNAGSTTGGQTVTITGTNFTGATAVRFGTTAATNLTVVSDAQLTATVPAHAAGTVNVTVTTPAGNSPAVSADKYTYDAVPTVSAISPASGARATVVSVTGTGFVAGAKVSFGSKPAAKVVRVSSTTLQATAPAGSGIVAVTVTTPGGISATSSADQFTYTG